MEKGNINRNGVVDRVDAILQTDERAYNDKYRHYIHMRLAREVAFALGRPLKLKDLAMLVRKDGGLFVCSECGQIFQPIRWLILKRGDIEQVAREMSVEKLQIRAGNFYIEWKNENGEIDPHIKAACGSPYLSGTCVRKAMERNRNPKGGRLHEPKSLYSIIGILRRKRGEGMSSFV
ncbi:MAG: hypothetical protein WCO30_02300 [bacterium]